MGDAATDGAALPAALAVITDEWAAQRIGVTLERIALAAVPDMADLCFIDLLDEARVLHRAAVAAVGAECAASAELLARRYPPSVDSPQPAGRVIRTGRSEVNAVVDDGLVATHTWHEEHATHFKRIGVRSSIHVPITGPEGDVLGALHLAYTASGRADARYSEVDLPKAEQFAARVAVAIVDAMARTMLREREEHSSRVEERLRLALEGGNVGTWDHDVVTGESTWDDRCRGIFGVPPGMPPHEVRWDERILHPDDRATFEQAIAAALTSDDGRFTCAYRVRRLVDGEERWVSSMGRAVRSGDQNARFVGVVVDVTELRHAEARLADEAAINRTLSRLGRVFASELHTGRLAQLVTDEATREVAAAFGAFFFNVKDDAGGSYMLYTLSGVPREAFANFPMPRATGVFGPTFRGEGVVRVGDIKKDPRYGKNAPHSGMPAGHLPVVSYLAAPVVGPSGEVFGGLFFGHPEPDRFTAVHERTLEGVASLAAVAFANARLYERVVEEQTRARAALDVARAAERRKDDFLAMLSHELRNPLAPILTAVQLLKMGQMAQERASEVIERQVRHLRGLVEDLLDVSRITSGKMELKREPLDVADAVRDAVEMAAPLFEQRNHRLTVDVPRGSVVVGDRLRLAQVIANLLTNAARYTPPGGEVEVAGRSVDGRVEVSVVDNGQGIPAELVARLWEPFVQGARPADQDAGGLGLGLALVRGLLELHGGSVTAHSDGPGTGSRFVVSVPLATEQRVAEASGASRVAPGEAPRAARPLKVLVVDDNRDHADLLSELLTVSGHHVVTAYDGAEALAKLQSQSIDAAVLDLGLPVMDGFELARRVRALAPAVRLIALSGYGQAGDKRRAADAGFDLHFVKPVDPPALLVALAAS